MAAQSESEESAIAATPTSTTPPHLGISGSTSSKAEETMRQLFVHGRARGRFVWVVPAPPDVLREGGQGLQERGQEELTPGGEGFHYASSLHL